jgi:hypothetical protein
MHGRRELRDQVDEALRSLGDSPDAVAERLEAAGVRGTPGLVGDCALAMYLSAVVTGDRRVRAVVVRSARAAVTLDRGWSIPVSVRLPTALRRFVYDFDARRYPKAPAVDG